MGSNDILQGIVRSLSVRGIFERKTHILYKVTQGKFFNQK